MNFTPLSELSDLSPDPFQLPALEVPTPFRVPLLRSLVPPAHKAKTVYQPRVYLSRFVPSSPFLTTLMVYSGPCRPRVLHRVTLMGFSPYRVTPESQAATPFLKSLSPHGVSESSSASNGDPKVHATPLRLQGLTLRLDRCRLLPVSLPQRPDPLLGFSCGTSLPQSLRRANPSCPPRPFGPVTVPS